MKVILINGKIIDCHKIELCENGNGICIDDNEVYPVPGIRKIVIDLFCE